MSAVTFPPMGGLPAQTFSDDGSSAHDMLAGGYASNFIPALSALLAAVAQVLAPFTGTSGGTANAYTLVPAAPGIPKPLGAGAPLIFVPPATNTGASTLTVTLADGSPAAAPIKTAAGADPAAGVLIANQPVQVVYYAGAYIVLQDITNGRYALSGSAKLADGQCRLDLTSSTTLTLSARDGGSLVVGGTQQTVPASLTLTNAGASNGAASGTMPNSAAPYIYAAMSGTGGAMALEWSTTGYSIDSAGRRFKTGDATRRLVGRCLTDASGNIIQALSWFNRASLVRSNTFNAISSAGTTYGTLGPATNVLVWGDEATSFRITGSAANSTGAQYTQTVNFVDVVAAGTASIGSTPTGSASEPISCEYAAVLSEGMHDMRAAGLVSGGTGTWTGIQYATIRG